MKPKRIDYRLLGPSEASSRRVAALTDDCSRRAPSAEDQVARGCILFWDFEYSKEDHGHVKRFPES